MSKVPLEFVWSSVGPYLFDGLPEELGNLGTSEVNYITLFCLIYRDGHVIRLIKPFGPLYQSHCAANRANFGSINLCREGDRLAILAVLLYTPSNLDKTGLLEGVVIQILDDALVFIVEDEVVGNESLDDRFYQMDKYDDQLYLEWSGCIHSSEVQCSDREPRHRKGSH
jgi:hypothetical protein